MCKMCCVHAALLLTTTISPLPPSLLCCIPPVVTRIPAMKSCGPGHNFNLYNTEYSDCSKLHAFVNIPASTAATNTANTLGWKQ